jgi:2-dehydropantoate 2-reductase
MHSEETIYILGSGAVGFPLAVYLTRAGRRAVAVRTSRTDVPQDTIMVTVDDGERRVRADVETVSLARLSRLQGIIVVAAKAHANKALAEMLQSREVRGDIVILQNGIGVEKPFLRAGFSSVYRSILYLTAQASAAGGFLFRPVMPSPIGTVRGDEAQLEAIVSALNTAAFPFRAEADIEREIWKKAIVNAVFNSICPLLDIDNGVFARQEPAAALAREVVRECVALTERLGLDLDEEELLAQIMQISRRSDGQLISTLQDIRAGRPTEIDYLNMEIARVAASLQPPLQVPRTQFLGKMILAKGR